MYQHSVSAEPDSAPMASPDVASDARADEAAPSQATEPAETVDVRDPSHPFREELARAMQAAAQRERLRIEGRIDDDANSHVAKVRVRASVEADELKRLAEDDVSRIRAWSKVEVERIRAEADVQVGERRDRLEEHLGQHASIIDGEIDRVSEAVESYRHELEVFFVGLSAVKDPSEIARLADAVPGPPDFELIRAIARADAVGRLSDLEAASESETPTMADPAADDDTSLSSDRPIDESVPIEAVRASEMVAVMDPAYARTAETPTSWLMPGAVAAPTAEATPSAEATPIAAPELVAVMGPAPTSAAEIMPTAEPALVMAMPAQIGSPAEAPSALAAEAMAPMAAEAIRAVAEVAVETAPVPTVAETAPVAEAMPLTESTAVAAETSPATTVVEPELIGAMDPALAEKAEAEAIADAAAAAETPDPEIVGAGSTPSEPNAATRFLRSLTAWGSSDHGNNGHK